MTSYQGVKMNQAMTENLLRQENQHFCGRGGVSAENRSLGFCPAFLDSGTGKVYSSCYANGEPAPFHLLDGLPDELVLARHPTGRVAAVKQSVTSGFVRAGRFYTREQAAQHIAEVC
jgi:hypothetical protein